MKKFYSPLILLLVLAIILTACSPDKTEAINQDEAVAIAEARFAEYLTKHPEMAVEDPVFVATIKEDKVKTQYWSVVVELQEAEYAIRHYEVIIRLDGKKVTLATG